MHYECEYFPYEAKIIPQINELPFHLQAWKLPETILWEGTLGRRIRWRMWVVTASRGELHV